MLRFYQLGALFFLAVLVFGMLLLPLGPVIAYLGAPFLAPSHSVDNALLRYELVKGSIQKMVFTNLRAGNVDVTDLTFEPKLLPLLNKELKGLVQYRMPGGGGTFNLARVDEKIVALSEIDIAVPVTFNLGVLLAQGTFKIRGEGIQMDNKGRCLEAVLAVRSDIIKNLLREVDRIGPVMNGTARCENDQFVIEMTGNDADIEIKLKGQATLNEELTMLLNVRPPNNKPMPAGLMQLMTIAGFQSNGVGWHRSITLGVAGSAKG